MRTGTLGREGTRRDPEGESVLRERAHPWEIVRLGRLLHPERGFGATVHRVRAEPLSAFSLESRAFCLACIRLKLPGCKGAFLLLLPRTAHSLTGVDLRSGGHGVPGLRPSSGPV